MAGKNGKCDHDDHHSMFWSVLSDENLTNELLRTTSATNHNHSPINGRQMSIQFPSLFHQWLVGQLSLGISEDSNLKPEGFDTSSRLPESDSLNCLQNPHAEQSYNKLQHAETKQAGHELPNNTQPKSHHELEGVMLGGFRIGIKSKQKKRMKPNIVADQPVHNAVFGNINSVSDQSGGMDIRDELSKITCSESGHRRKPPSMTNFSTDKEPQPSGRLAGTTLVYQKMDSCSEVHLIGEKSTTAGNSSKLEDSTTTCYPQLNLKESEAGDDSQNAPNETETESETDGVVLVAAEAAKRAARLYAALVVSQQIPSAMALSLVLKAVAFDAYALPLQPPEAHTTGTDSNADSAVGIARSYGIALPDKPKHTVSYLKQPVELLCGSTGSGSDVISRLVSTSTGGRTVLFPNRRDKNHSDVKTTISIRGSSSGGGGGGVGGGVGARVTVKLFASQNSFKAFLCPLLKHLSSFILASGPSLASEVVESYTVRGLMPEFAASLKATLLDTTAAADVLRVQTLGRGGVRAPKSTAFRLPETFLKPFSEWTDDKNEYKSQVLMRLALAAYFLHFCFPSPLLPPLPLPPPPPSQTLSYHHILYRKYHRCHHRYHHQHHHHHHHKHYHTIIFFIVNIIVAITAIIIINTTTITNTIIPSYSLS